MLHVVVVSDRIILLTDYDHLYCDDGDNDTSDNHNRNVLILWATDYTTIIVASSVVGASALIAFVILFQFIRCVNLSIKIYFPSNNRQLRCSKCYRSWKATREALRSLKLVAWTKNTNINTSEEREETKGETDINMCNVQATSTYTINNKSSIHTSWFFITLGHKSTIVLTYSERIGMQCY